MMMNSNFQYREIIYYFLVFYLVLFNSFVLAFYSNDGLDPEGFEQDADEEFKEVTVQPFTNGRCEEITVPSCRTADIRYNYTMYPNYHHHKTQEEASDALSLFSMLIDSKCSIYIRLYLCSEFVPMCTFRSEEPLSACRSMCLHVKSKCEVLLVSVGIKWPDILDCNRLPEDDMCIKPPSNYQEEDLKISSSMDQILNHLQKNLVTMDKTASITSTTQTTTSYTTSQATIHTTSRPTTQNVTKAYQRNFGVTENKLDFKTFEMFSHYCTNTKLFFSSNKFHSIYEDKPVCIPLCDAEILFKNSNKNFAEIWMFTLATICFISTAFVILAYLTNPSRFKYPERCIIAIAFCYNLYSSAYILRYFMGSQKIGCENYSSQFGYDELKPITNVFETWIDHSITSNMITNTIETSVLVKKSLDNKWCTVVFILTYYFSSAAIIWWILLSFTWFLSAGRKWSSEDIEKFSLYFHLFAWSVPCIKTIIALVWKQIDADELTNMCFIGNQDPYALLVLVIIPYGIYLSIGMLSITSGFVCMRNARLKEEEEDEKPEEVKKIRIMLKIGVLSTFYTIPIATIIACHVYHYLNYTKWFINKATLYVDSHSLDETPTFQPVVELYMLKIFMSFIVGVTTLLWVLTRKGYKSFTSCFRRACCTTVKTITDETQQPYADDSQKVKLQNTTILSKYNFQQPYIYNPIIQSSLLKSPNATSYIGSTNSNTFQTSTNGSFKMHTNYIQTLKAPHINGTQIANF